MSTKLTRVLLSVALLVAFAGQLHAAVVTVAWDPNPESDVVGYKVSWGTRPGVYTSSADEGTTPTCVVPALVPGVTYYFAVQAVNSGGLLSPFSEEVSFLVTDILSDEGLRIRAYGAATPLLLPFPIAIKTGTSSNCAPRSDSRRGRSVKIAS